MNAVDFQAGCGFFTAGDLEGWIEGRLAPERRRELQGHVESRCGECATLIADLETFRGLIAGGLMNGERLEGEADAALKRRLLGALRSRGSGR